ncbi:MAG: hypothetical protein ACLQUY_14485 [Ktedonobacterales bacterium]
MLHIRPRAHMVLPVLVALALASCGTSVGAGAATTPASPDSTAVSYGLPPVTTIVGLHVLRMSASAQNRVAPFEKTSTDVAEVQRFYGAVLQLKSFPPHFSAVCPVDVGVSYHLDFLRHGAPAVQAVFAGGCPGISIEKLNLQVVDYAGFSQLLAEALGVPVSQDALAGSTIVDTAPPGGPFAPPPPN